MCLKGKNTILVHVVCIVALVSSTADSIAESSTLSTCFNFAVRFAVLPEFY